MLVSNVFVGERTCTGIKLLYILKATTTISFSKDQTKISPSYDADTNRPSFLQKDERYGIHRLDEKCRTKRRVHRVPANITASCRKGANFALRLPKLKLDYIFMSSKGGTAHFGVPGEDTISACTPGWHRLR